MNVNDKILNGKGEVERNRALAFFKEYAVTTGFSMGLAGQKPNISETPIHAPCDKFSGQDSDQPIRSGSFDAQVIQFNFDKDTKGEVSITKAQGTDTNTVGAYYLPWGGMYVMSMKLPANPESNLFITSGLVGCSVFASGSPGQPTVYHAGTQGKYTGNVAAFWRACISTAAQRGGLKNLRQLHGINKNHYLNDPHANRFENWMKDSLQNKLQIQRASPGGFVFGLRLYGDWQFYLQERLLVETVEFVKKTNGPVISNPYSQSQSKLINGSLKTEKVTHTERKGVIFKKNVEVEIGCNIVRVVAHPVSLRKFFPTGSFNTNLVEKWDIL
jgi:hypothetical protein